MFRVVAVLMLALSVSPMSAVAADETDQVSRPVVLPALYASYAALQVYDAYSTKQALAHAAHETNPLMQQVVGSRAPSGPSRRPPRPRRFWRPSISGGRTTRRGRLRCSSPRTRWPRSSPRATPASCAASASQPRALPLTSRRALGWLSVSSGALRAPRTAMRVTTSTKFTQRAAYGPNATGHGGAETRSNSQHGSPQRPLTFPGTKHTKGTKDPIQTIRMDVGTPPFDGRRRRPREMDADTTMSVCMDGCVCVFTIPRVGALCTPTSNGRQ